MSRSIGIKILSWTYMYTTLNYFREICDSNMSVQMWRKVILRHIFVRIRRWCCRACPASHSAASRDLRYISYARVLFVDFSSAFNTIIPRKLIHMGVERSLCMWILDIPQDRPQSVRLGKQTSKEITLNVGAPQGCVLSPLLFSLFINDSVSSEPPVVMIKFSDDTTMEGLIQNSDKSAYRGEVERLAGWCSENDLELNVSKTKEMVLDFRKKKTSLVSLTIAGKIVEEVKVFEFLGTTISCDLKRD